MTGIKKRVQVVFIAVITAMAFIPLIGAQPAYAEGALPYVTVGYVNADDDSYEHIQLDSETPYYINGAQDAAAEEAVTDPEGAVSYNAYYDAENGVLTLNDYEGASVDVRAASGDLKIVLKGYNEITGKSQFGINVPGDLEITSEEGGMLSIEVGPYDENTYGICADGNVTISGDADIYVKAGSTGVANSAFSISAGEYPEYGELTITDSASVGAEAVSEEDTAHGFNARKISIDTEYMVSYAGKGYQYGSYALSNTQELAVSENSQLSLETTGNDTAYIVYDQSLLEQFQNSDTRHVDLGTAEDAEHTGGMKAFFRYEPHGFGPLITKATPDADGEIRNVCPVCGHDEFVGIIVKADGYKLSYTSTTYNGSAKKPTVKVTRSDGEVLAGDHYKVSYAANTSAGTAKAIVTFKGEYYEGVKTLPFTIKKAANTLKASGRTAVVKYSKVKKKAQTLKRAKVIRLTKPGQGTKTYTKKSGNKKITIAKSNGKVTVKKGLKKGTYKVKVSVKAKGTSNYKARTRTVTFKIRVK